MYHTLYIFCNSRIKKNRNEKFIIHGVGWHTPLISALGRQKQADGGEYEASLVYRVSSRKARAVKQRNPVSKKKKPKINHHPN